ncbi:anti-sigma factor [Paraflavisolibacter sp. H34]|uniref:anti-sigma factor n=1 Tax=Huijunlia imazamoxiresistens TaxID=3127457 RepID=UPI0030184CDE
MDLSCIISSGDLELYVLGLLPEDEAEKVGQLAALFPQIREEIDRITDALAGAAAAAAPTPSPGLKAAVLGRLSELEQEEGHVPARVVPMVEEPATPAPIIPLPTKRKGPNYWLAACILALVLCTGFIINLLLVNNQSEIRLALQQQQMDSMKARQASGREQLLAYRRTVDMMHSPDYSKVRLTQVPGMPTAEAQVFWNKKTGDVYLSDLSLPGAPPDKQYQLWAIVDGQPVDAGMLQGEKGVAHKMKSFPKAEMFAITLERKGGSQTPEGKMYVAGKV